MENNEIIEKQKQIIRKYEKENQKLKNRWEKLIKIIKKDIKENEMIYERYHIFEFKNFNIAEIWILQKMKKLEKAD